MKRPRRTTRGMLPVYRDVHPDKCPIELYCEDGTIGIRADLPAPLVEGLEKLARKEKVSFQTLSCQIVTDHFEKLGWGGKGEAQ